MPLVTSRCIAQTQQPFLFASDVSNDPITGIALFVRKDQTGAPTEAPGSPFTNILSRKCSMTLIDRKGRFGCSLWFEHCHVHPQRHFRAPLPKFPARPLLLPPAP